MRLRGRHRRRPLVGRQDPAVFVDDRLLDGTTTEVGIPTLADGADRGWDSTVGAIDPDAPPEGAPVCAIDRIGLADQLTD